MRLCPRCAAIIQPSRKLCVDCECAENRRGNQMRKTSGRTTVAWQGMRLAALHRDNFTCQREDCGVTGTAKTMTVHLRPALGGTTSRRRSRT